MINDHRCLSSCEVIPGELKRCVLVVGHDDMHAWLESLDRSYGRPLVARWDNEHNLILGNFCLLDPKLKRR